MLRAAFTTQRFARHYHECYAIGVIERGALGFRYRGENVAAPAGAVNLAVPGQAHTGHAASEEGWAYRMFYLDPEMLRDAAAARGLSRAGLPHFRPGVIHDRELARRVHRLHAVIERGRAPLLAMQTGLLRLLAMWIARHADEGGQTPALPRAPAAVARTREAIHTRCHENLSLDELAAEAGLSPFHLVRSFTRHFGLAPHEYLIQRRVERGKELLARGEAISAAALALGFADQSHFTRHFKRLVGLPPGYWRKIVQDR